MAFPLYTETYVVGKRRYRRGPYKSGATKRRVDMVPDTGDTPDLYADEQEDGPPCGVDYVTEVPTEQPVEDIIEQPAVHKGARDMSKTASTKKAKKEAGSSSGGPPNSSTAAEPIICPEDERVSFLNGKWSAKINVPSALMCRLIGTRGAVRRELEESTGCRLTIPRRGDTGPVEVKSFESLVSVQRCLDRIDLIIEEGRATARFTHFVAVPCTHPDIVDSYQLFRDAILSSDTVSPSVKDESLFTSPNRLHLTLSMVWLLDNQDEEKAKEIIRKMEEEIRTLLATASSPLVADVQGIAIMNDDPSNSDVLYAKVEGDTLQQLANLIRDGFVAAGLSPQEKAPVRLHLTLLNSRYVAEVSGHKRKSFDATQVLEEFGDFYFGTILVDKVSICGLHSPKSDGYYEEFCEIKLV